MSRTLLDELFRPKSVAVVGASASGSFGGRAIRYLERSRFDGAIYPVNPNHASIRERTCYASVDAIPGTVDAAVVAVPASQVETTIEQLGGKGCRVAVVLSSGFAETGEQGAQRERQMVAMARRHGMRIVGPNCNGIINVVDGVPLASSTALELEIPLGRIGVIAQSGSLSASIIDMLRAAGIGVSRSIAVGNGADLTAADYLSMLAEDEATSTIVMLLEGIADGHAFVAAIRQARAAGKHVIVLKIGKSSLGQAMAASHTASLAGAWDVFEAFALNAGAHVVSSVEELVDGVAVLSARSGPPRGVQIVSLSGALCGLLADHVADADLPLAELSPVTVERLAEAFSITTQVNPLDYASVPRPEAQWSRFRDALNLLMSDDSVDTLVVGCGIAHVMDAIANDVAAIAEAWKGKAVVGYVAAGELGEPTRQALRAGGAVVTSDFRRTAEFMTRLSRATPDLAGHLGSTGGRQTGPAGSVEANSALDDMVASPTEHNAKLWLGQHGVAFPDERVVTEEAALGAAGKELGYPLVMKISADEALHKTDLGLVLRDLATVSELDHARRQILDRAAAAGISSSEVLVVRQLDTGRGIEMLVGVRNDPIFGKYLLVSAGGIWTEVLRDSTMVPLPCTIEDIGRSLDRLRISDVLKGARGRKFDVASFCQAALAVSQAAALAGPRVETIELNPILVLEEGGGAFALDARVYLPTSQTSPESRRRSWQVT